MCGLAPTACCAALEAGLPPAQTLLWWLTYFSTAVRSQSSHFEDHDALLKGCRVLAEPASLLKTFSLCRVYMVMNFQASASIHFLFGGQWELLMQHQVVQPCAFCLPREPMHLSPCWGDFHTPAMHLPAVLAVLLR